MGGRLRAVQVYQIWIVHENYFHIISEEGRLNYNWRPAAEWITSKKNRNTPLFIIHSLEKATT